MRFKLNLSIVLAALAATLGVAYATGDFSHEGEGGHDADLSLSMDDDVEVLLLRIGITPEVLAAAGVTAGQVQSLLAAEQQDLEGAITLLGEHDATSAEAKRKMDALRRVVRSGLATDEEVSQLATAKTAHAQATQSRDAFLESICMGVCEHLTPDANAAVVNMITSKRWKTIPVAYRVESRTEEEWVALRNALSAKRTHENFGDEVPESVLQQLSQLDSAPNVAQSMADCEACLPGVDGLWESVFNQ